MIPKNWRYIRGDIYYANMEPHVGSEQGGERPVVVLQNDMGNKHSSTLIIATLTSKVDKKLNLPTIRPRSLLLPLHPRWIRS